MAYVGNLPWHGLGTKVEADLTPDQFRKLLDLIGMLRNNH